MMKSVKMKNNNQTMKVPWNWKHALLLWFFVLLGLMGVWMLIISTGNQALIEFMQSGPFRGCFIFVINPIITLLFSFFFIKPREFLRYIGFKKLKLKWVFISLLVGILMTLIVACVEYLQNIVFPMPEELSATYESLSFVSVSNWMDVLILFLLNIFWVAPCEEIFARGFVQRGFENSLKGKIILPIFISCLLFGAYHGDLWKILPLAIGFVPIGYLYYRTDHNISAPIIAHGFGNFFGVVVLAHFFGL